MGARWTQKGSVYIQKKHAEEPPLPIEAIRTAVKDVEEGRFHPDREKDELTRGLGNDEHTGRTRGTPGSKPWKIGFPVGRKKYPDRSRQRRKEREADRMHKIEEQLKRHQDMFEALSQQGATGAPSQRQIDEAAFDATGAPSHRKSSVASTELLANDDDAPTMDPLRYPVDDITEMTHCELHVKVVNITMKVAVGYALPIGPKPTFHCCPVPHGYAVVGVDEVMNGFEQLKLDYPAGEGDVAELGEAKKLTILWRKECIVFPNRTPRPSTPQSSNPSSPPPHPSPAQQSSSPPPRQAPSLPPHPSPAQPSSPPRQPSPPTKAQGQKRKRTTATLSGNQSPIRRQEPFPKVPKVPPHENLRPY